MLYNSRDAAITAIEKSRKLEREKFRQWSDPIYPCPKRGGNMRMNLTCGISLTCDPPIHKNIYQCDNCDYQDII